MVAVQAAMLLTMQVVVVLVAIPVTVVINKIYQRPTVVVQRVADTTQVHTDLVQVVA
jgi:hypothetical protein